MKEKIHRKGVLQSRQALSHDASIHARPSLPNSSLAQLVEPTTSHSSGQATPLAAVMQQRVRKLTGQVSSAPQPNHTGIPNAMKDDLEQRSGLSLDDVEVHYNSNKPAKLGAGAYAQGDHIHIASGEEQSLKHELTHVIQQRYGLVKQTSTIGGVPVNTDRTLEQQADSGSFPQGSTHLMPSSNEVAQLCPPRLARMGGNPDSKKDPDAEYVPELSQIQRNQAQGKAFEENVEQRLIQRGIPYTAQQRVKFGPLSPSQRKDAEQMAAAYGVSPNRIGTMNRVYDFYANGQAIECKSGNATFSRQQAFFDSMVNSGCPCVDSNGNPLNIQEVTPVFEHNFKGKG